MWFLQMHKTALIYKVHKTVLIYEMHKTVLMFARSLEQLYLLYSYLHISLHTY